MAVQAKHGDPHLDEKAFGWGFFGGAGKELAKYFDAWLNLLAQPDKQPNNKQLMLLFYTNKRRARGFDQNSYLEACQGVSNGFEDIAEDLQLYQENSEPDDFWKFKENLTGKYKKDIEDLVWNHSFFPLLHIKIDVVNYKDVINNVLQKSVQYFSVLIKKHEGSARLSRSDIEKDILSLVAGMLVKTKTGFRFRSFFRKNIDLPDIHHRFYEGVIDHLVRDGVEESDARLKFGCFNFVFVGTGADIKLFDLNFLELNGEVLSPSGESRKSCNERSLMLAGLTGDFETNAVNLVLAHEVFKIKIGNVDQVKKLLSLSLNTIVKIILKNMDIKPKEFLSNDYSKKASLARSMIAYFAHYHAGYYLQDVANMLGRGREHISYIIHKMLINRHVDNSIKQLAELLQCELQNESRLNQNYLD